MKGTTIIGRPTNHTVGEIWNLAEPEWWNVAIPVLSVVGLGLIIVGIILYCKRRVLREIVLNVSEVL